MRQDGETVNWMSLLNGQQLIHSGHLLLRENVVPDSPDLLIFFFNLEFWISFLCYILQLLNVEISYLIILKSLYKMYLYSEFN